jgi:GT2 family glycosyltransferase
LSYGAAERRDPSPLFDTNRYLNQNPVAAATGRNPLACYLSGGLAGEPGTASSRAELDRIDDDTFVSVVIVNWDGLPHLANLFSSLRSQTFTNFEILLVDNGSQDGSAAVVREQYPEVRIVALDRNRGFAEANNIGFEQARGTLVALLNNDTRVAPEWLEEMVKTIRENPRCVAVAPKIRFWSRFQRMDIRSDQRVMLDFNALVASLDYKKAFVRTESAANLDSIPVDPGNVLTIDLPIQDAPLRFDLHAILGDANVRLSCTGRSETLVVPCGDKTTLSWSWSDEARAKSFYLINNAGSFEPARLQPADRGYTEIDDGRFDVSCLVGLACGCSMLVRREALRDRPLFIADFFNYFEDTELSKRLRSQGQILYCPRSIVYHRHSATTQEKSPSWHYYVNRNRVLYQFSQIDKNAGSALVSEAATRLSETKRRYEDDAQATSVEKKYAARIPQLIDDIDKISKRIAQGDVWERDSLRIGLFNRHWNTFGGGEAHALAIAEVLQRYAFVDLISNTPFSIPQLEAYFGIDLSKARRRVVKEFTTEHTADYDIFVNASYRSVVPSQAPISLYVISFPTELQSREFVRSYTFLPNSKYTLGWARRYWGRHRVSSEVVYPAVSDRFIPAKRLLLKDKEKIILSVGRWFVQHHNKKQLEMAEAFVRARESDANLAEWRLILVGSLKSNDQEDMDYFHRVSDMLEGAGGVAKANVEMSDLGKLYAKAAVYWHAAGFGEDPNDSPERFEHFGMTVVEAAANGVVPMVFDAAGPSESVRELSVGYRWSDISELIDCLKTFDNAWRDRPKEVEKQIEKAQKRASFFRRERLDEQITGIVDALLSRAGWAGYGG